MDIAVSHSGKEVEGVDIAVESAVELLVALSYAGALGAAALHITRAEVIIRFQEKRRYVGAGGIQ